MNSSSLSRLINIGLRAMTLGSKFLLIFFLARFLAPAELGLYGLLAATIGYALYLLGLDFYTYTTREMLKRSRNDWGALLKNQGVLTLILYVLFLPPLLFLFVLGLLPWYLASWFLFILVLEHLNQELMRLLIAASEQLAASFVLFLRSGAWVIIAVAVMYLDPAQRNLTTVLSAWALGGVAGFIYAAVKISSMRIGSWGRQVDWSWIKMGVCVALPLLVATLAIRGLFTLDRYWLESLAGLDVLGAYVLYMGLASAMVAFLDAGVFAFIYPALITSYNQADHCGYKRNLKKLLLQTVILSVAFSIGALALLEPLLVWLNKPLYMEHKELFSWGLLAMFLYAIGMVPHYALYAQQQDRPIIHSHLLSLVVFTLSTWLFSQTWASQAVPMGLCVAFFTILVWKLAACFILTPEPFRLTKP